MEHVVFFPTRDGNPAFRRLHSLEDAVSFVEHLRNERDVLDVSVHALTEVPLAFRTVYRVEVAGSEAVSMPAPAAPVDAEPFASMDVPVDAEPPTEDPAPVATANGRSDPHSLGFFVS